jgi:heparinase II/III-like protein
LFFLEHPALGLEVAAHGDPREATASHGDAGRGSFEIWFRGRPVVVDGGVPTYRAGDQRRHFRSAAGQNVIAVDGVGPAILPEEAPQLPRWYRESGGGGTWEQDAATARFIWRGFRRHRTGLTWTRMWHWSGSVVAIEDRLDGSAGPAQIQAWLHFGEPGWRAATRDRFSITGCTLRLDGPPTLSAKLVSMPHATDYGVVVDGEGILLRGRVALPAVWKWSFEFDASTGWNV